MCTSMCASGGVCEHVRERSERVHKRVPERCVCERVRERVSERVHKHVRERCVCERVRERVRV